MISAEALLGMALFWKATAYGEDSTIPVPVPFPLLDPTALTDTEIDSALAGIRSDAAMPPGPAPAGASPKQRVPATTVRAVGAPPLCVTACVCV